MDVGHSWDVEVAPCTVLNSGFHAVDSRFQELDSSLCQWNLDSGFQSLMSSRITGVVFRIPKSRIPDSNSKISLDYGFHMPKFCTFWYPNSLRPVSNVLLLPC